MLFFSKVDLIRLFTSDGWNKVGISVKSEILISSVISSATENVPIVTSSKFVTFRSYSALLVFSTLSIMFLFLLRHMVYFLSFCVCRYFCFCCCAAICLSSSAVTAVLAALVHVFAAT